MSDWPAPTKPAKTTSSSSKPAPKANSVGKPAPLIQKSRCASCGKR